MGIIPILLMRKLKLKTVIECAQSYSWLTCIVKAEIHSDSSPFTSTVLIT